MWFRLAFQGPELPFFLYLRNLEYQILFPFQNPESVIRQFLKISLTALSSGFFSLWALVAGFLDVCLRVAFLPWALNVKPIFCLYSLSFRKSPPHMRILCKMELQGGFVPIYTLEGSSQILIKFQLLKRIIKQTLLLVSWVKHLMRSKRPAVTDLTSDSLKRYHQDTNVF